MALIKRSDIEKQLKKTPWKELQGVANTSDLYIDCNTYFCRYISDCFDYVDVLTYTIGQHYIFNVRRCVASILCMDKVEKSVKELRVNTNNHTKLYIGYRGRKVSECFVGSYNLRAGLNFNIMIKAPFQINKELKNYFEEVWNQSQPFKK